MEHKNAVLQGLEDMRVYDSVGNGIVYSVNNINYTIDQMIEEVKNETEIGNQFSQSVYDTILSYLGKFN
jgi:hypothetical protein